jgi:hypothetical protein
MYIHQSHLLSFAKNEMRVAEIMSEIEYSLKDLHASCDGSVTGLYLVSEDAGMEASVQLWENALQHSPAFANPKYSHGHLPIPVRVIYQGNSISKDLTILWLERTMH